MGRLSLGHQPHRQPEMLCLPGDGAALGLPSAAVGSDTANGTVTSAQGVKQTSHLPQGTEVSGAQNPTKAIVLWLQLAPELGRTEPMGA